MFRKVAKLFALVFGVVLCLGLASPALALEPGDVVIQARPAGQELELAPGGVYQSSIEVSNLGRLAFDFTVSIRPYQVLNENYDPDFTTENSYTELSKWVSFDQAEYHLEPETVVTVDFEIAVPDDVPGGGQYAAIIIETDDSKDASATMQTISQLAALIFAHIEGEEHVGGVIISQNLPHLLFSSPFQSIVTVKNDGNVDFRLQHSLTIRDFFTNREVFTPDAIDSNDRPIGTSSSVVLPATTRTNILTWDDAPSIGIFRVISRATFLDQEYTKEQIAVLCPVWLAGLIVFFIFLLVLWLVVRTRQRHQDRPQVM